MAVQRHRSGQPIPTPAGSGGRRKWTIRSEALALTDSWPGLDPGQLTPTSRAIVVPRRRAGRAGENIEDFRRRWPGGRAGTGRTSEGRPARATRGQRQRDPRCGPAAPPKAPSAVCPTPGWKWDDPGGWPESLISTSLLRGQHAKAPTVEWRADLRRATVGTRALCDTGLRAHQRPVVAFSL